eukprot:1160478-Pelagomonas_calceolata.AAC.8
MQPCTPHSSVLEALSAMCVAGGGESKPVGALLTGPPGLHEFSAVAPGSKFIGPVNCVGEALASLLLYREPFFNACSQTWCTQSYLLLSCVAQSAGRHMYCRACYACTVPRLTLVRIQTPNTSDSGCAICHYIFTTPCRAQHELFNTLFKPWNGARDA